MSSTLWTIGDKTGTIYRNGQPTGAEIKFHNENGLSLGEFLDLLNSPRQRLAAQEGITESRAGADKILTALRACRKVCDAVCSDFNDDMEHAGDAVALVDQAIPCVEQLESENRRLKTQVLAWRLRLRAVLDEMERPTP